jgi:PAS domain S-box-containing protein
VRLIPTRLRTIPMWAVVLIGGALLITVYFAAGEHARATIYAFIGFASGTIIIARARVMPEGRFPWLLLGLSQLLWAAGDASWATYELILHTPAPYPSTADVFYLAAYPMVMAGLILFARRSTRGHSSIVLRDALIVALLVGMAAWQLVVEPYLNASGLVATADIVGISYPIMDVLLIGVVAALFLGSPAKSVAISFLLVGVAGVLVADGLYSFAALAGTYDGASWYNTGWLFGYVLVAAAACHPSAHQVDKRTRSTSELHFRTLFGVGLAAICVVVVQDYRGQRISPIVVAIAAGGAFLLAVSRMAALHRKSRQQLAAVMESEAKYHSLLDHASDAIFITKDGSYVDVNMKAIELTGYSREELLSSPVDLLTPYNEHQLVADDLRRALAGETVVGERHLVHKDGGSLVVESSQRMMPDGRVQSTVRDIRERKAAEETLRNNEELLSKVFDSGVSGIGIGTAQWDLVRVNETFARMLGYEPKDLIGVSIGELTHPDDRDVSVDSLKALLDGETREVKIEKRYLHRDGHSIWTSVALVLVRSPGKADAVIAHVVDISRSKALEESLRQAQMMEAVGQLAGGVAHDFNNLLSVIQNFTRFVYDDLDPGDPKREDLEEVLKAGDRGASLVRQLLTMARREPSDGEVFDINELISEMSVLLGRTVTGSISLDVSTCDDDPYVNMDRSQFEQILLNLTLNARDAMPGGGALNFSTEMVELSANSADLAQVEPGMYVRLRATDNGMGMTPDVRRRIFEPFFTTKERGAGMGLGLATLYGVVTEAKGGVVVESEIGRGTTFDIYLPAVDACPEKRARHETSIPAEVEGSCILVVDDEDAVRNIVVRILKSHGYRVLSANSLQNALAVFDHPEFPITAVISDVVMPNGSGLELVEQLRLRHPELPALFMSGYTGEVLSAHGLPKEDRYVGKPFTADDILRGLSDVLKEARPTGEPVGAK